MTYNYKIWFPISQKFTLLTEKEYNKALDVLRASKGCFSITTWTAANKQIINTYPWTEIYLLVKEEL